MLHIVRPEPPGAEVAPSALPDAELVLRVIGGEPELFEVLVRRYSQRVFRAIRSVLRSDEEAEDAMQEAWLDAYLHLARFRGVARFDTWVTGIALAEAVRRAGRAAHLAPIATLPDAGGVPDAIASIRGRGAAGREAVRRLERAIDQLPAPAGSAFVLRDVEGMPAADAALALAATEVEVDGLLRRARRALRELLGSPDGADARDAFAYVGWRCERMVADVLGCILGGPAAA